MEFTREFKEQKVALVGKYLAEGHTVKEASELAEVKYGNYFAWRNQLGLSPPKEGVRTRKLRSDQEKLEIIARVDELVRQGKTQEEACRIEGIASSSMLRTWKAMIKAPKMETVILPPIEDEIVKTPASVVTTVASTPAKEAGGDLILLMGKSSDILNALNNLKRG